MTKLRVLDLFSGIGGFSLGLERTGGFETVAFCEHAEYPRAVLLNVWPKVPCYDDVIELTAARLAADGIIPDIICGGFPCQDISVAGRGAGLDGARSGLWFEMLRIIAETRPAWVIAENVAALRGQGLGTVLRGLAEIGYDAEWHYIPAAAIGAPHRRDRIWIVAYANSSWEYQSSRHIIESRGWLGDCGETLVHTSGAGLPGAEQPEWSEPIIMAADIRRAVAECYWRRAEPRVGGTDDGISRRSHRYPFEAEPWEGSTPRTVGRGYPNRRQRLMALGNSIVPQMAELIGRAILRANDRIIVPQDQALLSQQTRNNFAGFVIGEPEGRRSVHVGDRHTLGAAAVTAQGVEDGGFGHGVSPFDKVDYIPFTVAVNRKRLDRQ